MKLFIAMCLLMSNLLADRLLIPLISKHNTKEDLYGEKFNEVNLGIGYEFDIVEGEDYLIRFDVLALNDSYSNPMYSATIGIDYKITSWFRLGVDFGVVSRSIKHAYHDEPVYFKREVLPVVFIPTVTTEYKEFSLSILHIPQIDYEDRRVDGVTLLMLGYSF